MKDKLTKKKKRFDYYQFLIDKHLYGDYCRWKEINFSGYKVSEYKLRHDFIVSRGLFNQIKDNPLYDEKIKEVIRIAKTPVGYKKYRNKFHPERSEV